MTESSPDMGMEKLKIKILIADDDTVYHRIYRSILSNYTVEAVENGRLLLERLEASRPNEFSLVLTDNSMPIMTGLEALNRIRAQDRFKDLPVIVCTGDENIKTTIQNADGVYFPKPFDIDELRTKVESLIGEAK